MSILWRLHCIFKKHFLVLNVTKSTAIFFGNKNSIGDLKHAMNIKLKGTNLQISESAKYLRIIVDRSMILRHTWNCDLVY